MLGHLIRKEILDHLLGLRFLILTAIGALTIWLSLYDGYAYYQARLHDYRLAQAATEQRIRQIRAADTQRSIYKWYELNNFGFREHKPPVVMSVFIRGLDPTTGRSISNISTQTRRLRRSPVETEPILGVFLTLDLGLVAQVVMSLFVLLFTYDAVSGEKERGTLRLMASFPVSRPQYLMGKALGILLPILAAFYLPLLLGIGVMLSLPELQIEGQTWVRLGLVLAGFGLYLAAFACAGLLGSCLTHRSATSFVLLLTFWIGTVVVLPRLSLIAADILKPAPSVHEHQSRKNAISMQTNLKRRELCGQWQQAHLQPGKEWWRTPEGLEANRFEYMRVRDEVNRQSEFELNQLDEAFRNRYQARLGLAVTLARLSPAFALKNAALRLAGTGLDRHQRFERSFADDYAERYRIWYDKTTDLDLLRDSHPAKYGKSKWDVSDLPRFTCREIGAGEEVRAALPDLAILAVWASILFAGACVAMLRYDPR